MIFSKPGLLDSSRWRGLRIGLLGGSFNPPHEGHVHISQAAMKGLGLDVVWWLVSPQNPLKSMKAPPIDQRLEQCRALISRPHIVVSDIERDLGTSITYFTIKKLKQLHPATEFVWISGMDNALSLHTWNHWKRLLEEIPTVHLTRKPATSLIRNCPLRLYGRQRHVFIEKSAKYPLEAGITYWMLQKKMVNISSTEIRMKTGG
jgi:nicotinate-nucleotide adenylyltransferase